MLEQANHFFVDLFIYNISEIDCDRRITKRKNIIWKIWSQVDKLFNQITNSQFPNPNYLYPVQRLNWNDTINLFSKLTPRRFWNASKVLSSYYVSKWTKKPIQWGYPVSISFEPTTSCNLRCPECPSGLRAFTRPTGMLKKDFFTETIDQLSKDLLYLVFYFQGEPYLNPDFLNMVKYASSKK